MALPEPISSEEFEQGVADLLAEGGQFTALPMTVRGIDYPRVFAASAMSVGQVFAMKAREFADREFLVYGDERYTTAEAWARAMRVANWLRDTQGVVPGQRVAIAMRNYPEWCIAYLGIVAAGATVVPMNAWWQGDELRRGIERAGAKIVFCDQKRGAALLPCKDELDLVFVAAREEVDRADADMTAIMADDALPETAPQVAVDPDSDFCLLYTSGSTGDPKGVLLTHRSCVNAVLSWSFALNVLQRLRPSFPFTPENPGILLSLPLFHVTASHVVFLLSFLSGRKIVFQYRWDPAEAAKLIRDEKLTTFVGVPTMAAALTEAAGPGDLETLNEINTGGAKRPESQLAEQMAAFPQKSMGSGYGLSETNALGTVIAFSEFRDRPSSTGRPVPPVTEVEAFGEDGSKLARGETGEVCIKSPATFRCYLDDEAATADAYFPGGWFRTGDLGYVDDEGFLFIVDRKKDLIIRGGENISGLEVENVLLAHDDCVEASVFAVPDDTLGEIVGAAVHGTADLDAAALHRFAAERLAAFKVPARIWVSPTPLPRGTTGKIDKKTIRAATRDIPVTWSAD